MSAVEFDTIAQAHIRRLEKNERERSGHNLDVVRESLARRLGTLPGTVENLSRGRIKGVRAWLRARIEAAVIHELTAEITRLTAERDHLVQGGFCLDSELVREVEAHTTRLREILKGAAQ